MPFLQETWSPRKSVPRAEECPTVVYDDIIHGASEADQAGEGLVHTAVVVFRDRRDTVQSTEELKSPKRRKAVVVFRDRRDTVRSAEELKSPKWRNERSQQLTFFIQGALVVPLQCVELCKNFRVLGGDISYSLCWGNRLISFSPHVAIQM